ncbi:hypothetical protein H8356DRAFT_1350461 [Neocallimastix lanati (nom. inval.)]|nr:hypothetical protein H8356DRAFT_1350461 [Neocallimastix sp. JGI-2020a]
MKGNINKNNNELITKNDRNLTKSELPDKKSYEETTGHSTNDSNEESNTIKGISGNNKMKTKPKLKFKKSYNKNTYNKFNQNLLVAVFSFQKLMFICLQTKREIRANSHESDFFPHHNNRTIMKGHNLVKIRTFTIQSFQSHINNYEYMNPEGGLKKYFESDVILDQGSIVGINLLKLFKNFSHFSLNSENL